METDERRIRWQQARDLLKPEEPGPLPSRRALLADALLAFALTLIAVAVAHRTGDAAHFIRLDGDHPSSAEPSMIPEVPEIPAPPEAPVHPGAVETPERLLPPDTRMMVPGRQPDQAPLLLTIMTTLPLAARRRYPLSAFGVMIFAAGVKLDTVTWFTVFACVIGAYSAAAYSRYRTRAISGLLAAALLAGVAFEDSGPSLPDWSGPFFILLVAGVIATLVRSWRQRLSDSQRRLADLEDRQEEATRRAVEVERARIAAELHDVVTHNVSVMVIQTGAARKAMDARPDLSRQAMLAVEASGRAAMAELRHVMGLLSASENERLDGLEPQPGLEQLEKLVERVRAAGTPVTVEVSTPPEPLPPGLELTAYRVVQEALTNTIKHAAGASAAVRITHDAERLEIEVTDTGGVVPSRGTGNGRGLIGLRERLAVYDGTLEARRRPGGGYLVRAQVPWPAT
ncbi:sensor histidine kinase [Actinocorallia longicatena]|uniref:histidine kinase n=1 Tax=Actinocorallia longicatena TaxID=111803 RepID=A0ABP6PXW3_9ACTN